MKTEFNIGDIILDEEINIGEIIIADEVNIGEVVVDVSKIFPELEDLVVTPTKENQTFNHVGKYGYDNVNVNAIPDEYIVPTGKIEITQNGTYNVNEYASAKINTPTPKEEQNKSIVINENGTTNVVPDEDKVLNNVEITTYIESEYGEKIITLPAVVENTQADVIELNAYGKAERNGLPTPLNPVIPQISLETTITAKSQDNKNETNIVIPKLYALLDKQGNYICRDELIDVGNGYYWHIKTVEDGVILTSSNVSDLYSYSGFKGVWFNGVLKYSDNRGPGMSTHCTDMQSIWTGQNINFMWLLNRHVYWIGVMDVLGLTTLDEMKAWLDEQEANGTPVKVWHKIPQPIATKIYLGELKTQPNYTNIEVISEYAPEMNAKVKVTTGVDEFIDGTITEFNSNIENPRDYLLYDFPNITNVNIPKAKKISNRMCYSCENLKEVNAPNATSIGGYAFQYNSRLTTINAPEVLNLGGYTFQGCSRLVNANLPKITNLGVADFYGCSALKVLDFHKLTQISPANALTNCTGLQKLILRNNVVVTLAGAFSNNSIQKGTCLIYVPDDLLDSYKTATNWSTYANQIKGLSEL